MMDQHPELAQMMNNPQMLREAMRVAANPVRAGHGCAPVRTAYLYLRLASEMPVSNGAREESQEGCVKMNMIRRTHGENVALRRR